VHQRRGSKLSEIVAVRYQQERQSVDPLEEELRVPWSVCVSAFLDTLVEFGRKVLASRGATVLLCILHYR
jgi:hypothetical protein